MKQIKIKSLHLENFKGCKKLDISFGDRTNISGENGAGKSTIFDAFTWLLFNKDSNMVEKFQVRPLDSDGNRIDNVVIMVEAVLDVDGIDVILHKDQAQNWVKRRGSTVTELQGNANSFEVNTIPFKEKDYKEYISELVGEELFKLITNPNAFTALPWKDQRSILIKLVSEITDEDVASMDIKKYGDLLIEIQKYTFDGLMARAKKALKEHKDKQKVLPALIDEVGKQIVDIDVAELELQKNVLNEQIVEVEKRENDLSSEYEEYQKQSDLILEKKMELNDMVRSATDTVTKRRREVEHQIYDFESACKDLKSKIEFADIQKNRIKAKIVQAKKDKALSVEEYNKVKSMEFDESSTFCPMCGQAYPEEKAEQIVSDFTKKKSERIKSISEQGNLAHRAVIEANNDLEKLNEQTAADMETMSKMSEELSELQDKLNSLPDKADMTDNSEFQKLQSEVSAMQQAHEQMNSAEDVRNKLKFEKKELREQMQSVISRIASADNSKVEERIEELRTEQKVLGQKVADQERQVDLLESFSRDKMNLLSTKINEKFKKTKFILFKEQLNGGYTETCECEYNGIPYNSLNSGHRIVVGLDIVDALQNMYEVSVPVWLDNAETLNDSNLPDMNCQMIRLRVTDDKKLKVGAD